MKTDQFGCALHNHEFGNAVWDKNPDNIRSELCCKEGENPRKFMNKRWKELTTQERQKMFDRYNLLMFGKWWDNVPSSVAWKKNLILNRTSLATTYSLLHWDKIEETAQAVILSARLR